MNSLSIPKNGYILSVMIFFLLHACTDSATKTVSSLQEEVRISENGLDVYAYQSEAIPSIIDINISIPNQKGVVWAEANTTQGSLQTITYEMQDQITIPIVGAYPSTELEIIVHAEIDGNHLQTSPFFITNGPIMTAAAQVDFTITEYEEIPKGYFMGTLFGEPEMLVIFDTSGTILWAIQQYDDAHGGIDSRVSVDNRSILFNRFSKDKQIDDGAIHRVGFDGTTKEQIELPLGHHTFTELPDGTITYISLDIREVVEFGDVCGDAIIEVSPSGQHTTIFSTWDHIELYESASWESTFYPQGYDWTHGNGLLYLPDSDTYLFSMAGVNLIVEIDRNGNLLHKFGGQGTPESDYQFEPLDSIFAYPHGHSINSQGHLMLLSTKDDKSQFISYEIDEGNQKLRKRWHYGAGYQYNVRHLGEIVEIEPNLHFVNWGSIGHLQLVDKTGNLKWELHSPLGFWFAQFDFLYELPGMER